MLKRMLTTLGALLGLATMCVVQVPSVKGGLSCAMDGSNPCIWDVSGASDPKFNGKIDISNVFQNGPIDATPAGADFKLDACKGVACTDSPCGKEGKGTCVMCETVSGAGYGIGDLSTASCDVSQSDPASQKWILKLSYVNGAQARQCDVNFTYSASDKKAEFTFDQEKPTLDYHFSVMANFTVPSPTPSPPSNLSCTPVSGSPCNCTLSNGATGTIDLSPLFSKGALSATAASAEFTYLYDACVGVPCAHSCGTNATCAACQQQGASYSYGLGALNTVTFDVSRSDVARGIWIVEADYSAGEKNRHASVVFEYVPDSSVTLFEFQMESPALFYNFLVFGRFTVPGGPKPSLQCFKEEANACKCTLNDGSGSLDFSPLFANGPLNVTSGEDSYLYDPCNGVQCKESCQPPSQKCAACQTDLKQAQGFGLGSASTALFDVSRSDPSRSSWIVTAAYSGGSAGRSFDVVLTHVPSALKTDFQFLGEKPNLSFHLALYGNNLNIEPFLYMSS